MSIDKLMNNGDYLSLLSNEAGLFLSRLPEQIYGVDSLSLARFLSRNVVRTALENMSNRLSLRRKHKMSVHVEIADL